MPTSKALSLPRETSMPNYLRSRKEPKTDLLQNTQEEKACSIAAYTNPQDVDWPVLTAAHRWWSELPDRETSLSSRVEETQQCFSGSCISSPIGYFSFLHLTHIPSEWQGVRRTGGTAQIRTFANFSQAVSHLIWFPKAHFCLSEYRFSGIAFSEAHKERSCFLTQEQQTTQT